MKEIHSARYGKRREHPCPRWGSFCLNLHVRTNWKISKPYTLGLLWRLLYIGMIDETIAIGNWTQSPATCPSRRSLVTIKWLSCVRLFETPWTAAHQASLSFAISQSMFKLMSIGSGMPSKHLVLSPPSPPAFSLSQHQVLFKWVSSLYQVPKYWSFIFSISPSNEYSGVISFRIHWFDLLGVQGTLKSLLQHHRSKASVLQCSAFFMVHLSHLYMTTGKTIALTRQTFVGKVICLLFSMLSRLVIAFLPRSKRLLISWLKSLSTVMLEPKKIKSVTFPLFPLLFSMKWWDWMPWS